MKKILSLLAVAAISTPTAGLTSGWTENNIKTVKVAKPEVKFDASNLSTWGEKQKFNINRNYIYSTIGFPLNGTWSQWVNGVYPQNELNAISLAFQNINPNINFRYTLHTEVNANRVYLPVPKPNATVKDILFGGIKLVVCGFNGLKGKLEMTLTTNYL